MTLPYATVIAMVGGEASGDRLPPTLPRDLFDQASLSLYFVELVLNAMLAEEGQGRAVRIVVVQSASISCMVFRHGATEATIIVPVGLLARLRLLARLLLQYWGKEKRVTFLNSPLDKIAADQWFVPPLLRPIFGSYGDQSDAELWRDMEALDGTIELDAAFAPDILELTHLALVHLVGHEFAHFWKDHFSLLDGSISDAMLAEHQLTRLEVEKGLELHADQLATNASMSVFLAQLAANDRLNDEEWLCRGFLRFSYVATLLYTLYDPQRKFLHFYDQERYTHPIIRRQLVNEAAYAHIRALNSDELTALFAHCEFEGHSKCYYAIQDLNLDVLAGRFGELDPGKLTVPVHVNEGGVVSARYIEDMLVNTRALMARFEAFIDARQQMAAPDDESRAAG